MNCQRVQDNFIDYQDGSLPADESARGATAPRGRSAPESPRGPLRLRRDWVEVEA